MTELRSKPDLLGNRAIFTAYERTYCEQRRDPWASLGGLIAAKEACIKLLASFDDAPSFTFLDLEIRHAPNGRPVLQPGRHLAPFLEARRLRIDVSISHSSDYATAIALASPSAF